MGDDIQAYALFILRAGDEPRRPGGIGGGEHGVAGSGIFIPAVERLNVHRRELPDFTPVVDAIPQTALLLLRRDLQPVLEQNNARFDHAALHHRRAVEELLHLLRRTKAHHPFDAGAVIPAAIENHDFAGRREMLDIALKVKLAFFALGGRG